MWSDTYGCQIQRSGESGSYNYSISAAYANRPVNYVNFWDACRFANWLHNGQPKGSQGVGTTETGAYSLSGYNGADGRAIQRNDSWKWAVTSEDEWYKAAYYNPSTGGYNLYPTSSNTRPGRDLGDVSGNNANYYDAYGPWPIDPPNYITVAGEFQNSSSPYGTYDQGGNVWEWSESIIHLEPGRADRNLRGGAWGESSYFLLRTTPQVGDNPALEYADVGFRVSQVPEPTTFMLLALTLLGVGNGASRVDGRRRGHPTQCLRALP